MKEVIIDVREKDEFKACHIPKSMNIPLSSFSIQAPGILGHLDHSTIILMCRSGNRAKMALDIIEKKKMLHQESTNCKVFEGGILAWQEEKGPIIQLNSLDFSIMRQTHLIAGLMALVGTLLGLFVNNYFFLMPIMVGIGLSISGITGFCGMSIILSKLPWNAHAKSETCSLP